MVKDMSWFLMALGGYHVLYLLKWLRNMSWFLMALGGYHVVFFEMVKEHVLVSNGLG